MDIKLGTWGLSHPPFDQTILAPQAASDRGYDFFAWYDQSNGFHPTSIHTPDITPAAAAFPDMDRFFDPAPLIASAAQGASDIEFLYGPLDPIRRAPSVLAQSILTLDHATKGRTITCLAQGEGKQLKPYGMARLGAKNKLWDAMHIVRGLVDSQEPISYEGRVWKCDRALMSMPSYSPRPKIWLAGGGDEAFRLIGTIGDGWFMYAPPCAEDSADMYGEMVQTIHAHASEAKRDPAEIDLAMIVFCLIAEDEKALNEIKNNPVVKWTTMMSANPTSATWIRKYNLKHPMGDDWTYSRNFVPYWHDRAEALALCDVVPREAVGRSWFCGTPEQILDQLKPYASHGLTHATIFNYSAVAGYPDLTDELAASIRTL